MTEHWLDKKNRLHQPINPVGFQNPPRISAQTMLKLITLKNSMLGIKRSLHDEQMVFEENNGHLL